MAFPWRHSSGSRIWVMNHNHSNFWFRGLLLRMQTLTNIRNDESFLYQISWEINRIDILMLFTHLHSSYDMCVYFFLSFSKNSFLVKQTFIHLKLVMTQHFIKGFSFCVISLWYFVELGVCFKIRSFSLKPQKINVKKSECIRVEFQ